MISTIRKCVLIAGGSALLSAQAAYAAPTNAAPAVDPLVAVSLFGTSQSRAAVCGNGAACSLPMATSASPVMTTAAATAAVQNVPRREESTGLIWILGIGGAMILIAVLAATLGGGDDAPVSPE
ncbi:MAG TPA: hypothetical protein VFU80_05025 [Sphingomicrobium sp.]|nr:hypothetical protein [Sphingomicrobium sp.]